MVLAYRQTTDTVNVGGTNFRLMEPVGGYGLSARHDGPVGGWKYSVSEFDGTKLERVGNGAYALTVPVEGVVSVNTAVETMKPLNWCEKLLAKIFRWKRDETPRDQPRRDQAPSNQPRKDAPR
jgi:hypothetical protein